MPLKSLINRLCALLGENVQVGTGVSDAEIEARLVPCEMANRELKIMHELLRAVEEKERSLRKIDISSVMVHHTAFGQSPIYHGPETLRTLHELRTRAYGKVVVVQRAQDNRQQVFRIAQANIGFPDIGVLARLAPVARNLVSSEVGDDVDLPAGVARVVAVAHMERYSGHELTAHMEDFRRFALDHEVAEWSAILEGVATELRYRREDLLAFVTGTSLPVREHVEDIVREVRLGDTELLSAQFYTRTSKLQERLMQRSSDGLAVVLGVAGSGKTSVALGRTKVLCDRTLDADEKRFFTTESAVGFVLSSQLCTYLEKTCQQLALFDMPVREYHWLRSSLFELRRLDDGGFARADARAHVEEGTMRWLRAADNAVAARIAKTLRDSVATPPGERESVRRVTALRTREQEQELGQLWEEVRHAIILIADSLEGDRLERKFRLERLAARIDDVRARFAVQLESSPQWTGTAHKELRQNVRGAVRERIVRALRLPVALAEVASSGSLLRSLGQVGFGPSIENTVKEVVLRFNGRRLSDADIDVLLSLAHLQALGYRGRNDRDPISQLTEPNWYTQVFIDEFQDFTEVQLFLMGAQADPSHRTVTVVGDPRQRLRTGVPVDLLAAFPWSSVQEAEPGILLENKRQTGTLARLTHGYRELILGDDVEQAPHFSSAGERPRFIDVTDIDLTESIHDEVVRLPRHDSVAVVCPTDELARGWERELRASLGSDFRQTRVSVRGDLLARFYVHFTTALEAKGLEFDATIVAGLEGFSLDREEEANGCYVAISRPRKNLSLIGNGQKLDVRWQKLFDDANVERLTAQK